MHIKISADEGSPIYQQIVNQIKYLVASSQYQAGDQLPPVRRLAEQLIVNPNTVARAYRELESAGVITMRQGSGAFIAENGSPLASSEKTRILNEKIDVLLAESKQMGVNLETLMKLIRQRNRLLKREVSS